MPWPNQRVCGGVKSVEMGRVCGRSPVGKQGDIRRRALERASEFLVKLPRCRRGRCRLKKRALILV
jgi:hypothetical protein